MFDNWFNEQSLYESGAIDRLLATLREKGYIYDADGAVWFRMTEFGGDKDRVAVKSTGEPTYVTPDIAYHINKLERGFDPAVNILGPDHMGQYPVVAAGVKAMGYDPSPIHVIIHQAVARAKPGQSHAFCQGQLPDQHLDLSSDVNSLEASPYDAQLRLWKSPFDLFKGLD